MDTNVLIAAYASTRGACAALFEHCVRNHTVVTSEWILKEFQEQLTVKCGFGNADAEDAADILRGLFEVAAPAPLGEPVCRDPDDDHVLAAALGGRAECIVTGDKDLLVLGQFQSIPILRPAEFQRFRDRKDPDSPGQSGHDT